MTQLETLQATIAQERVSLEIHKGRLKVSEYFRDICQRGLNDLEEAERCLQIGDLASGQLALQEAIKARIEVDAAVKERGYGVIRPHSTGL